MELVVVLLSRVFWLFNTDEVRPVGGTYLPTLVEQMSSAFRFIQPPPPETWGQGLTFTHGQYISPQDGREIKINSLNMHMGSVWIEVASGTEDAEEVLNSVVELLLARGFRKPGSGITLLFNTALVVDMTKAIDGLVKNYNEVSSAISRRFHRGGQARVQSMEFRLDPSVLPPGFPADIAAQNPTMFRMEVRSGAAYDQKRYYAEANLRTMDLLSLLEELEGRL